MMPPQGLNRPETPTLVCFEISARRKGGSSEVAGSATMSTTPVDNALNISFRPIGNGEAPQAEMIGAKAAPGVNTFVPLRSASEQIGLSREVNTACDTP